MDTIDCVVVVSTEKLLFERTVEGLIDDALTNVETLKLDLHREIQAPILRLICRHQA